MTSLNEVTIKKNMLFKGRVITLMVDDVRLPDGSLSTREYVRHRGGAAVLAVDDEEYAYLVRQFRYPYGEVLYEIPAGKLENGEAPSYTAGRELGEETGLVAERLEDFGEIYPSPGYTNEHLYIFYARVKAFGEAHPDSDEFVQLVRLPLKDVRDMILDGRIKDAKTCFAVLKYFTLKAM